MNKLLLALGLSAAVVLVGCSRDNPPQTDTTGNEHVENSATPAIHDTQNAASDVAGTVGTATDSAITSTGNAIDNAGDAAHQGVTDAANSVNNTVDNATSGTTGNATQHSQ